MRSRGIDGVNAADEEAAAVLEASSLITLIASILVFACSDATVLTPI